MPSVPVPRQTTPSLNPTSVSPSSPDTGQDPSGRTPSSTALVSTALVTGEPSAGSVGLLLIVEVMYDPPPPATEPGGEWLVLRNTGATLVQMHGWRLRDAQADTLLPDTDVPVGATVLVAAKDADNGGSMPTADVRIVLPGSIGNGLRNRGDMVALVDGLGSEIDAVSWGDDHHAFDPAVPLAPAGTSIQRYGQVDTNTAMDWIEPDASEGSPPSTPSPVLTSPDPGGGSEPSASNPEVEQPTQMLQIVAPTNPGPTTTIGGSVVSLPTAPLPTTDSRTPISIPTSPPVLAANFGATNQVELSEYAAAGGWVEVYNRGTTSVDLRGWSVDIDPNIHASLASGPTLLPAHGFALFTATGQTIASQSRQIRLLDTNKAIVDIAQIGATQVGRSWSRYPVQGGGWMANTPQTPGTYNQSGSSAVMPPTPTVQRSASIRSSLPLSAARVGLSFDWHFFAGIGAILCGIIGVIVLSLRRRRLLSEENG